jgi:hypothetical protein
MRLACRPLVLALVLLPAAALAGSTLTAGKLSVNGLEVRDVSCTLEKADFLGLLTVVGALAKEKAALDACAPGGAAFAAEWAWAGGKATDAKVARSSKAAANGCVAKALRRTRATVDGRCTGTVLVGEAKAAAKAADALPPAK